MCTAAEMGGMVRMKLRDFGHYFEVPYTAAPIFTLRLPHPIVPKDMLTVWQPDGTLIPADPAVWELDQRNGILKFKDPNFIQDGVGVSGYYYEWFLDEDLEYAGQVVANQVFFNRATAGGGHSCDADANALANASAVECDVIAVGATAQALWALLSELAVDIDVSTPEGISIPASERFRQVMELAGFWGQLYQEQAQMLGIGLTKIEQFWLRRVSRLTNRLVPIIKEREIDDMRPPHRLLPPIPPGIMCTDPEPNDVVIPEPPGGIGYGGWTTIGTSGTP